MKHKDKGHRKVLSTIDCLKLKFARSLKNTTKMQCKVVDTICTISQVSDGSEEKPINTNRM